MAEATIGDRLASLRTRRALTQEELAERAGISVATVRKLERNERTSVRMATLHRLATALEVTTSDLLRPAPQLSGPPSEPDSLAVLALRRALTPVRSLPVADATDAQSTPVAASELRQDLAVAVDLYQRSHLSASVEVLSMLLEQVRSLDATEAALGAQVYHLAAAILTQLRLFDLAYLAVDRSMDRAEATGDPLLGAAAVSTLAFLLLRQGRLDEAAGVSVATADAIEPKLSTASREHVALWGRLLLAGSAAFVRDSRHEEAADLLSLAASAAARVGGPTYGLASPASFGPERVDIQAVENHVVLAQPDLALDRAERVEVGDMSQQCRFLLDVASAQVELRRYADAVTTLSRVYDSVPEWFRYQRYAAETVRRLLRSRKRTLTGELRTMADFLAVDA